MAIKVKQFTGDGTSQAGESFVLTVTDPDTGDALDDVTITCKVLTKAEARGYLKSHTKRVPHPSTRQMVEEVDTLAAIDAMMCDAVLDWTGFVGADDAPLVCTPETIGALDDRIKAQVAQAIMGAEVTGRGPSTFRSPATVSRLVG